MLKINKFLNEHKLTLFFIVFTYLYQFIIVSKMVPFSVDEITYAYFSVDYSMGFCTKILPGAIYNKLVGVYSESAMNVFVGILFFLFVVLVSFLLERYIKAIPKSSSKQAVLLVFLFLTGTFTIQMFVDEYGMLDFFWALFAVVSLLLLKNKYARWIVPVLLFATILVHYSSLVCYVAGILLIILFYAVVSKDKKEKASYYSLFSFSLITVVAETLYFLKNDYSNLTMSVEEFDSIMISERYVKYLDYYNYNFYRIVPDYFSEYQSLDNVNTSTLSGFLANLKYQISIPLQSIDFERYWFVLVLALVLFVYLAIHLFLYIKKAESVQKKFIATLMILLFFCIFPVGLILSTDLVRWLGHSFIVLFAFVFIVLSNDYNDIYEKNRKLFDNLYWFVLGFFIVYSVSIFRIYS